MKGLTQVEVRRVLCYIPFSGTFMWRVKPRMGIQVGAIAGSINHYSPQLSYRLITIHGRKYLSHRLAFLYMRGYWPHEIDHKDGNSLNNRWLNLRECTRSQNAANRGVQKNNKLGIKGVRRMESGKYRAHIQKNGKTISLGYYDTSETAARVYKRAAKKLFGEFSYS